MTKKLTSLLGKYIIAYIALLSAGVFCVSTSFAATTVTNMCTSTYQMTNGPLTSSGFDTAAVRVQTNPIISISKIAYNERSRDTQAYMVNAISGDTIMFVIIWSNTGEAEADSATINDYIPAGLTYIAGSVSETAANANGTVTYAAGLVQWAADAFNDIPGTDPGPAANGIIRFRATVN